ncbi:MAG: UDP-N-acetylmuramoyl-L-alanyl-D-glutamate--2,6-diaminopimelate ligase [Neisseriaceae bacterium]|nr:UDP-N-acetylmuramoyl-L-alanyl-D-glutamate--2,6-diaminopimelate ligase [Neisseriaceae bacterium]
MPHFLDFISSLPKSPSGLTLDSRQVVDSFVFIALKGEQVDGRDFIQQAIKQGALAVIWEDSPDFICPKLPVPNWGVSNIREELGQWGNLFYNAPSTKMPVIGVTGTNGKTSIALWLGQALTLLTQKTAILGTVGNGFHGELSEAANTTPDALTLQRLLADYLNQGAKTIAMEVSSHGLEQGRVNGVSFDTAVFTNLTRDHLDYHGDMLSYGRAKERLFYCPTLRHAVINIDDDFGMNLAKRLAANSKNSNLSVIRYGLNDGDVFVRQLRSDLQGLSLQIASPWGEVTIESRLIGDFNVANFLACFSVLCAQGFEAKSVGVVLGQIKAACGRMDQLGGINQALVVIDYAHTPDALEKALFTLVKIKPSTGRLFCVFGCGGDRDVGKRPLMGAIAARWADVLVLTSDNPRTESPSLIIDDIIAGLNGALFYREDNRQAAIEWAISQAHAGDVVLIAGKGHENYQIIGETRLPFSDFEVAKKALNLPI